MQNSLSKTYILLIVLTICTALAARFLSFSTLSAALILGIATVKFLLVTFQFMELKKANIFWKIAVLLTLLLIVVVIFGILL